jgi:hypothetical protein
VAIPNPAHGVAEFIDDAAARHRQAEKHAAVPLLMPTEMVRHLER